MVISLIGNTRAVDPNGHNHGVNQVGATLHWGPDAGQNRWSMTHGDRFDIFLVSSNIFIFAANVITVCIKKLKPHKLKPTRKTEILA